MNRISLITLINLIRPMSYAWADMPWHVPTREGGLSWCSRGGGRGSVDFELDAFFDEEVEEGAGDVDFSGGGEADAAADVGCHEGHLEVAGVGIIGEMFGKESSDAGGDVFVEQFEVDGADE